MVDRYHTFYRYPIFPGNYFFSHKNVTTRQQDTLQYILSTTPMQKKAAETYTKKRDKNLAVEQEHTAMHRPKQGAECTAPLHKAGSLKERSLSAVQRVSVRTHSLTCGILYTRTHWYIGISHLYTYILT